MQRSTRLEELVGEGDIDGDQSAVGKQTLNDAKEVQQAAK